MRRFYSCIIDFKTRILVVMILKIFDSHLKIGCQPSLKFRRYLYARVAGNDEGKMEPFDLCTTKR